MHKYKIGIITIYPSLNNNESLFGSSNTAIGDDLLEPMICLKKKFAEKNAELSIYNAEENFDSVIFVEYPNKPTALHLKALKSDIPKFLTVMESKIIAPHGHRSDIMDLFSHIFTWSDDILSKRENASKVNLSHNAVLNYNDDLFKNKNDKRVMISGNKRSAGEGELYSERLKIIDWYTKNSIDIFDLYGFGWCNRVFTTRVMSFLARRMTWIANILYNPPVVYKGEVKRKRDVLPEYKFGFALENATGENGYITEKIFDMLFNGVIPIYKGAPNISEYIPRECYIDYNDFSDLNALEDYLSEYSTEKCSTALIAFENFWTSKDSYQFKTSHYADVISDEVLNCLQT